MTAVLNLLHVSFVRDERFILSPLTWRVRDTERWLVLGANGSGKTTLLRIASMYEHPSSGTVEVLGERLGRTDVRELRQRVGYMSAALAVQIRQELKAIDVVMTAKYAALEPWWHRYTTADEQQRVLLARTLMNAPGILLLDEPSARLDLGGREQLVLALSELTLDRTAPPLVLVTHHLDEVPPGMTHVLMLRDGKVVTKGPIDRHLTAANLSRCFDMPLQLQRRPDGRLSAWNVPATTAARARS
jgi:iron complex transport system ATP-binding protein